MGSPFTQQYYARYYLDPRTRVTDRAASERLARFAGAYAQHLGLPVRRALDLGCGLGYWRAPLQQLFPRMRYTGVEVSEYLCATYGWQRGSVVDYAATRPFDLVICQGVLQYLDDAAAAKAVRNLAKLCAGALFVEALTREDWRRNVDRRRTDGQVHLRPAEWYREQLARAFEPIGGGLHLRRGAPVTLFELERPRPPRGTGRRRA
jgi:SAM-dependent methyltransferase